jgi:hypothetical protein
MLKRQRRPLPTQSGQFPTFSLEVAVPADDKDWWKPIKAREEALSSKVVAALADIKPLAIEVTSSQKVWFSHFGATGIDPKHLVIFGVLPTRAEVGGCINSGGWKRIQDAILQRLRAHDYPVESLGEERALLFSQEECDEEAKGNWYYFFK